MILGCSAGCLAATGCSAVFAGDAFLSLVRQAPGSSRSTAAATLLPVSISVVTADDIALTNTRQTTDILEQIPGVFIRKTGAFGRADVDIRGIGDSGRQIGVFIDGRPDKMGLFGCSVTHALPLNNVERIEVIRGPESVRYGSEAFGGVVNIITRRAQEACEGSVLASCGSFNTQNYRVQEGGRQGKFDYYLSLDKRSSDGHMANAAYQATDMTGQAGYAVSGGDLSVSAKYFTGIKNEPYPSAAGTWNEYNRGSVDATLTQTIAAFSGSAKLYRSFGEHTFSDGFHSRDYTDGCILHGRVPLHETNELSMGIDGRYQVGEVLNIVPAHLIGTYHKYEYGLYVDDQQVLFDRLTVNAGARWHTDEYAGSAVTPRCGAVYQLSAATVLRGLWSQGFRAPQLNDLYLWAGNRNLQPEKITTTEAGVRQAITDTVFLDMGAFIMQGADLIEIRSGNKMNTGSFEFRGIESACTIDLSMALHARAQYTFFDPGSNTTGRPGDQAGLSLTYAQGRLSCLIAAEYIGRYYAADNATQKINDYTVVNTKVSYRVLPQMTVFCAVDNVTNQAYQIYNSGLYTMPGCTVDCGVRYDF
jgi:iron complex outermembrane receptor protein